MSGAQAAAVEAVGERYAVAVTPEMLALMPDADKGSDPYADPIGKQFLPQGVELDVRAEELADPIGDEPFTPIKGITHRYPDRVLLKPVHVCPVYCRFCFRREKVGPEGEALTTAELEAALAYVRAQPQVWEVILSGGDPLVLSPRRLREIVSALDAIPHVAVVRVHTRVPAVDPGRVTDELVAALGGSPSSGGRAGRDTARRGTATWVVLHTNHPRELTPAALDACARLVDGGVPMLSQSVLLRGVNDDADTLATLFRTLVAHRIKPYYLHHPDLARGTGHFRVTLEAGQRLMRRLRGRVSGLCQPTYVLDLPGGHGKVPVGPVYARLEAEGIGEGKPAREEGSWTVEDPWGSRHRYPPGRGEVDAGEVMTAAASGATSPAPDHSD